MRSSKKKKNKKKENKSEEESKKKKLPIFFEFYCFFFVEQTNEKRKENISKEKINNFLWFCTRDSLQGFFFEGFILFFILFLKTMVIILFFVFRTYWYKISETDGDEVEDFVDLTG